MKSYITIVLIVVFCGVGSSYAQRTRTRPTATPSPTSAEITLVEATTSTGRKVILKSDGTWAYSAEKPIEAAPPKRMQLPVVFDDPISVADFFERQTIWRNQYDTEQEHAVKLAKIKYPSASGERPLSEIVIDLPMRKSYNAELETFTFEYGPFQFDISDRFSLKTAIRWNDRYSDSGTEFKFKMPTEKAREVGYQMKVVAIGYPVNTVRPITPISDRELWFYAARVVVYDARSGEIYHEAKPKNINY